MLQQRKLLVGENNLSSTAPRRVLEPVQLQIARAQFEPRLPFSAQQRPASCAQLMQAERLGHQIVGAPVQAAHPRVDLLTRGQHQHRKIRIEQSHFFKHLLAILHWHVQVKNCQIRQLLAKCLHRRAAIIGQVDAMPVSLKATAEELSQRLVVFGNE